MSSDSKGISSQLPMRTNRPPSSHEHSEERRQCAKEGQHSQKRKHPAHHSSSSQKNQKRFHQSNNFESRRGQTRRRWHSNPHQANGPSRFNKNKNKKEKKKEVVTCCVCEATDPKYKCPKCLLPYCSIACCRQHKETMHSAAKQEENTLTTENQKEKNLLEKSKYIPSWRNSTNNNNNNENHVIINPDDLEDDWIISKEMEQIMQQSSWLSNELQDGGLCQILHEIMHGTVNSSSGNHGETQALGLLQQYMDRFPNFKVFMDKLKVLVGVLQRPQTTETATRGGGQEQILVNDETMPLETWLTLPPNVIDLEQLTLVPTRRQLQHEQTLTSSLPPKCVPESSSSSEDGSSESSSENETDTDTSESSSSSSDDDN